LDGGVRLTGLHPGPSLATGSEADSNNNSIVTRLLMGEMSVLLPGDIEAEVERELVQSGQPLASTVLKVPHHGSDTSSTSVFLEAASPQVGSFRWVRTTGLGILRRRCFRGWRGILCFALTSEATLR
jgi:beta-lactamase superfamily II metal-dependent hydrolase